ncbi:MAG: ribose 5-phosphate isomerase B [Myxococcales bacterium]|nr:ribose 5-phosphate isomerase B [Myxococcales bacterium]
MRLVIACDHGGLALKNTLKEMLAGSGHELLDIGTHTEESVDYPDFGKLAAEMVAGGEVERGILICGTGIGMSITANKVRGIRAALCTNEFMAKMARRHNDANMLVLGGRVLGDELAKEIVAAFLATGFDGGRHEKRLQKIAALEK